MSNKSERLEGLKIDRADIESTRSGSGFALAVIAILLVVIGAASWWWYTQASFAAVTTATVEVVDAAAETSTSSVLDASGYVTARRQATVSSKVTGKIVEVLIEEGMVVEEGQVLARLDDSIPSRQLALAEAELERSRKSLAENEVRLANAQLDLRRGKPLVEANVAPQSELDDLQTEVDAIKARLALGREEIEVAERRIALRRQELEDTVIRAPFDGVVVTKNAQPGEMISPVSAGGGFTRTGIGTVVDMGSLEIEVDVNEAYINRVTPGQAVEAVLDAYPDWKIPASVIIPVPTADRQKATVRVRIGFDELGDPRLLPDMGIKVSFLEAPDTSAEAEAAAEAAGPRWRIPAQALRRDGEQDVVFVVRGETVERRAVRVDGQHDGAALVAADLEAGELVVIAGPEDLADGDPVKIEEDGG